MKSWLNKQTEIAVSQFDQSMEARYPESSRYCRGPVAFLNRIIKECNYLDAVEIIEWDRYIPKNGSVLDLGGGIGWLSAYLSRMDRVDKIVFLDSSRTYINHMLPGVFQEMGGVIDKLTLVEGLFSPLLLDDNAIDTVVASAALHHAENLETVLKEIYRILKPGGYLLILNEIPYNSGQYLILSAKTIIKLLGNTIFKNYKPISQNISSSCVLNDPHLGDKIYPLWFWNDVIRASGFTKTVHIKSKYSTLKEKHDPKLLLSHFVCQKDNDNLK
jgi:ubiquinone/menaquinone biosynthesis C-methylase UbiE